MLTQIALSWVKSQQSNLSCLHSPLPLLNHPPLSPLPYSELVSIRMYKTACEEKNYFIISRNDNINCMKILLAWVFLYLAFLTVL